MSYEVEFATLWEKMKESIKDGTFAKLTLAKTIGNTDIKNIFVRPMLTEDNKMLMEHVTRYKQEEIETKHTIEESFEVLKPFLKNPFQTVLLFTTEFDLVLKINKKGVGTISDKAPTFQDPSLVMQEMVEKGLLHK